MCIGVPQVNYGVGVLNVAGNVINGGNGVNTVLTFGVGVTVLNDETNRIPSYRPR